MNGESTPSRIASVALRTGDIDCMYHLALPGLLETAHDFGFADAEEVLDAMIQGKMFSDIADLSLGLAI